MADNDILVRVGADVQSLVTGMKRGTAAVEKFGKDVDDKLSGLRNQILGLGLAFVSVRGSVEALKDAFNDIDAQSKLARALDGTVAGLRAAEMAFDDAGVSSEEFSNAATKLNKKLGDAATGTGTAAKAMQDLGLSASTLLSLDIDQRFAKIADAMAEHNVTGAEAQSILADLGIKSTNVATALREGGDAFRESAEKVKILGLNISQVDARKIEIAKDAFGDLGDVLGGVQDQLAVSAAPYLLALSNSLMQSAQDAGGLGKVTKATFDTIISGIGFAADGFRGLHVVLKGVMLAISAFNAAIITGFEGIADGATAMFDLVLKGGNALIDGINSQWGTDFAHAALTNTSDFMSGLREIAASARQEVANTAAEMQNLAMKTLPSDKLREYQAEVEKITTQMAQDAEKNSKVKSGGATTPIVSTGDPAQQAQFKKDMDAWNAKNAQELEAVKNRYITEEQLNAQHRQEMLIIGETFDATKFESEAQWRSIKEQAEAEHLQRITDLNKSAYDGIQGIIESSWSKNAASTAGALQSILGTMATKSKKAFDIAKTWALADAAINMYKGISVGVSKGFAGIPEVAWAAATGYKQITAIRNQHFGGAGGAAASGNGTPATAPNPIDVGGSSQKGSNNQTLTLERVDPNAYFSGVSVEMLVKKVIDYQKDGGKLVYGA